MTDPNATPPYDPNQPPPAPGYSAPQQPPAPAPGYQQPQYAQAGAPLTADQDKLYASLCFFLNIVTFIPTLIIWLIFKDRGPKVNTEGKEALNWGINVTGLFIVIQILSIIFGFIPVVGFILGILFLLVIWAVIILNVVFSIIGGIRVNGGGSYRYPFNIRWIK